ncbi:Peptidyl-prolyl cis-trans isomerase [Operophtera brumata]|uniref:Peptidyl-prolyl cis-trans isomerase n=1 Tax=Operophtera brumata TaxID=104452 RepID=A0A0L7L198_OPEBR|nr:Peptidyl-prolyl cis-trans isomerase [Operophtera brumata]
MTSQAEFHLDMDFKPTKHGIDLTEYGDLMLDAEDDGDSDADDIFDHVEKRTEEMMLSSPEYLSFEELSAKMVDVPCKPSGSGPVVPPDAEVTIHYAAYWEKAKRIRLGAGRCLPGLEIALCNVRGPAARLLALLMPEVAWGPAGAPPRIRAEPALFVIALYTASDFNELPMAEQTKFETTTRTVQALRSAAREHFQRGRYRRAVAAYQQAVHVLSLSRPDTNLQKKELSNLRLGAPQRVLEMCENVDRIIHIEGHCKALFYKGRALQALGKLPDALACFKAALRLEPNNKEIGTLLADLDRKMKKGAEDELRMWQRAFNAPPREAPYRVDEEFQSGVRALCGDLAARADYSKVRSSACDGGRSTRRRGRSSRVECARCAATSPRAQTTLR